MSMKRWQMRYGIALAAGLTLLLSGGTSVAGAIKPQDTVYGQDAVYRTVENRPVTNNKLSAREAMVESVARIALRGAVPHEQNAPIARADLLRLSLLLALQDSAKSRTH